MTKGIIQTEQQWPRKEDWYMGKNERDEIRRVYLNEGDERSRKAPWGRRTVSESGEGEGEEWWALECRVQGGMWEPPAYAAACGTVWVGKVWKCHQDSIDAQSVQPRRSKAAGWESLCSVGCRAGQWALISDPARCRRLWEDGAACVLSDCYHSGKRLLMEARGSSSSEERHSQKCAGRESRVLQTMNAQRAIWGDWC